jgi:hypothetical protein
MTDAPDPSVAPEPAPRASYVDHEPPARRAWPYALIWAIFNFLLGAGLINGSIRTGPAIGLLPVGIEIVFGLILRRTHPRVSRILLLAPLMMLGIVAGLFVLAWGICSSMGKF